ncbi:cytochrome P450 1A1-like [Aplysia californica]|uniref:Cytochrome P450 1A1-like n=1 Tax=Aplysia californica TaxID=6500 RepID=A0ABM1VUJ4_APLCA|nr:cytochrome P450 1A1-like [Aplysia californica]
MVLTTLVVATLTFLATYFMVFVRRDGVRSPPYPIIPLPFVGHLLRLDPDPRAQFRQWRKLYGDVFSLDLGRTPAVILNGYRVIKEALVKNGDAFSDRSAEQLDTAKGFCFLLVRTGLSREACAALSSGPSALAGTF